MAQGLLQDTGSLDPSFSPRPGQGTSFSEIKLVLLSDVIGENNQLNFTCCQRTFNLSKGKQYNPKTSTNKKARGPGR